MGAAYAELQVTTNYSFLRGASHVEELVLQAQAVGLEAIGVTDRNNVAGIVRAYQRTQESGLRLVCRSAGHLTLHQLPRLTPVQGM